MFMSDETNDSPSQQQPERQQQRPQRSYYKPRRYYNRPKPEPSNTPDETPQEQEPAEAPPQQQQSQQQPRQQRPQHRDRNQQRPQQFQIQRQGNMDVSVVIPLYNEDESLKELHKQLRDTLGRMNVRYELIFVDDGSTDRSFQVLRELKRFDHQHVKVVRFRRNFGKSAALAVGFEKAIGTYVVTMDADLQDDPAEIPSMIKKMEEGYDLISGWKKNRKDPISKTIPSKFFNFITGLMTGIKIHDFNCGLKAYRNEVVKSVNCTATFRYLPTMKVSRLARWWCNTAPANSGRPNSVSADSGKAFSISSPLCSRRGISAGRCICLVSGELFFP
jgi:hypothetical protein